MIFIVGVTYDLASTLELKSKEELPCVDVFLSSDVLTAIIVTVIQYFVENYHVETIPLQNGKIYAYIISVYLNYHG